MRKKVKADDKLSSQIKKVSVIAEKMPSLNGAPGIEDPFVLAKWAAEPDRTALERVTARFILAIYDPRTEWGCGRFDLDDAGLFWDEDHHRAFSEWASDYWFVSGFNIPKRLVAHYPSFEDMAKKSGDSIESIRASFSKIMHKCGVQNLAELSNFMTMVRFLSHGGSYPHGEA